jgi:hypothetical protein
MINRLGKFVLLVFPLWIAGYADIDETSFLARVNVYGDGKMSKGYLTQTVDRFGELYNWRAIYPNYNDSIRSNIPPGSFLYVNRIYSTLADKNRKNYPIVIADSLFELRYKDTLVIHYLIPKTYDLTKIDAIELDSILWGNLCYEEKWVDSATASIFKNKNIIFHFKWCTSTAANGYFLDIVSFDTSWTEDRFTELFNLQPLDSTCETPDCVGLRQLHPDIQKAIRDKKLFLFEQWTP